MENLRSENPDIDTSVIKVDLPTLPQPQPQPFGYQNPMPYIPPVNFMNQAARPLAYQVPRQAQPIPAQGYRYAGQQAVAPAQPPYPPMHPLPQPYVALQQFQANPRPPLLDFLPVQAPLHVQPAAQLQPWGVAPAPPPGAPIGQREHVNPVVQYYQQAAGRRPAAGRARWN